MTEPESVKALLARVREAIASKAAAIESDDCEECGEEGMGGSDHFCLIGPPPYETPPSRKDLEPLLPLLADRLEEARGLLEEAGSFENWDEWPEFAERIKALLAGKEKP